jgi:hypothetical protein
MERASERASSFEQSQKIYCRYIEPHRAITHLEHLKEISHFRSSSSAAAPVVIQFPPLWKEALRAENFMQGLMCELMNGGKDFYFLMFNRNFRMFISI